MAVEDGVDGAGGRDADLACKTANEDLADFSGTPMGLVAFSGDNEGFDLGGELVGVADGTAGPVGERDGAVLFVALEQLVSGFAGDTEYAADVCHWLPVEEASNEAKAFIHNGAFLPRHRHLRCSRPAKSVTHVSGTKRHLCLRTDSSYYIRILAISAITMFSNGSRTHGHKRLDDRTMVGTKCCLDVLKFHAQMLQEDTKGSQRNNCNSDSSWPGSFRSVAGRARSQLSSSSADDEKILNSFRCLTYFVRGGDNTRPGSHDPDRTPEVIVSQSNAYPIGPTAAYCRAWLVQPLRLGAASLTPLGGSGFAFGGSVYFACLDGHESIERCCARLVGFLFYGQYLLSVLNED